MNLFCLTEGNMSIDLTLTLIISAKILVTAMVIIIPGGVSTVEYDPILLSKEISIPSL